MHRNLFGGITLSLLTASLACGAALLAAGLDAPADGWLFERYRSGEIDTIRSMLSAIPESSAAGQFFRGVFERDGEAARFYYDRVVALWPGSEAEAWALDRLWQYHWAKGDGAQAERYYRFLVQRHPDFQGLTFEPDFSLRSGLIEEEQEGGRSGQPLGSGSGWSVQVGAFSRSAGAQSAAGKVERFGQVTLIPKVVDGRRLTAVMVGRFERREDAERLAKEIQRATGLKGRVVAVEGK